MKLDTYKQQLALSILHHTSEEGLSDEDKKLMLDLENEYELIQRKESKYSRMKRDEIVYVWESIKRKG